MNDDEFFDMLEEDFEDELMMQEEQRRKNSQTEKLPERKENMKYTDPHWISSAELKKKYGITEEDLEAVGDVEIE